MPTITLNGCSPVPLAHYLKALGILRLITESAMGDACATACWINDRFMLASQLDREKLIEFFLHDYRPTSIMVPWSGGDFFAVNHKKPANSFKKTPTSSHVIEAILSTTSPRFADYRTALHATFAAMERAGVMKKKDIEGSGAPQRRLKAEMLKTLRGSLPDEALAWIDAASIVEPNTVAFNALLGGGGGSDGNSHFSDNFMQCLWMALPEFDTQKQGEVKAIGKDFDSRSALTESLFGIQGTGTKISGLSPVLFDSTRVGGPNQTTGFEAKSGSNPWDFIFMIEGSILFAGAIGRKLTDHRAPSARFPFLFQASPVGLGSSYFGESSGRELWLPLWSKPTTYAEIRALIAEGRVEKHGRMAKRGTDAFVAAAQLGFDRGITAFQRTGFFKGRIGGDNYFTAIDQGQIVPRRNHSVDLLRDVDGWLTQLSNAVASDKCPASVSRSLVNLDRKIVSLALAPQKKSSPCLLAVISALGSTERSLAKSLKWTTDSYLHPLHGLRERWLAEADDNSHEFRLAQSLASTRAWLGKETSWLRQNLEPLEMGANEKRAWINWDKTPSNDVVWHEGDLTEVLNAILARRVMRANQAGVNSWPDWSPRPAHLDDITAFIEGRTNNALLTDLIWGLSLIEWETIIRDERRNAESARNESQILKNETSEADRNNLPETFANHEEKQQIVPSSFYALLRLCFRRAKKGEEREAIPIVPEILRRAMNGDGETASELASRRLRASGKAPLVKDLPVSGDIARRTAAAMLFPISGRDFYLLEKMILKQQNQ